MKCNHLRRVVLETNCFNKKLCRDCSWVYYWRYFLKVVGLGHSGQTCPRKQSENSTRYQLAGRILSFLLAFIQFDRVSDK